MPNKTLNFIILAVVIIGGWLIYKNMSNSPESVPDSSVPAVSQSGNPQIIMHTSMGDITLELFQDKAPKTTENFLKLAQKKFYDGTLFHRVIKNFMLQGGDPLTKSQPTNFAIHGTGGPGYQFADEMNDVKLVRGILAMANAGPDTNGSQFFIITAPATDWLDGKHTPFGKVISGMEIVDKIENVKVNENAHPLEDVKIESVEIK